MPTEKRLIDADELIDRLNHTTMVAYPNLFPGLLAAAEIVDDSPTVDAVEVVHGEWIDGRPWVNSRWKVCSICHNTAPEPHGGYCYCPNCGAKMDGENKIY